MARQTPQDLVADAWRVVRNPQFWKVVAAATTVASGLAAASQRGYQWVLLQRVALERKSAACAMALQREVTDRQTIVARLEHKQDLYEAQLRLLGREHVRFVAATRRQNVDKTVAIYDQLVEHWPCDGGSACLPPARAIDVALHARVDP